jgi:uncharacterized protein YjlB
MQNKPKSSEASAPGGAGIEAHLLQPQADFPNNPRLPALHYKGAVKLPAHGDAATTMERVFTRHGWTGGWRNGVFNYPHYHSNAHEVLGCYAGKATLQLGGSSGIVVELARGDVLVLPAGVAHKSVTTSPDFKVVGAYANGTGYDMQRAGAQPREEIEQRIAGVALPERDPVHGEQGPLREHWAAKRD